MPRTPEPETPTENVYRLSLVVPTWNEEATIEQAIDEAVAALSMLTADFEVIVVNDGSTDRTAEIVERRAAADPRVRHIAHKVNRGYGAALRSGFEAAHYDLVAFTDADCQFDLTNLRYVLPLTRHYEIACGARIDRKDPVLRRFYSWGYNTLVRLLLGSPVHDLDCALKVFRRERLATILPETTGFFVNAEMLSQASSQGATIVEVGVQHRPRSGGHSKVSLAAIPRTLNKLLPYWWTRILFPGRPEVAAFPAVWFWCGLLLVASLAGLGLFANLDHPLFEPDEGRYAEIAREMLVDGQWIVPTLHHEPYLDKPPLFYWLVTGSYALFGTHEWAARLVPAAAAWLTIVATYLFGCRVLGVRAAFLAAFSLVISVGFVQVGRFLVIDSLLGLWVALSLFCAYEALRGPRVRWRWWLTSAFFCGLGILTKGPVAVVLLLPPVVVHQWLSGGGARPRVAHWLAHLAVSIALAAPWFITVVTVQPGFVHEFIWTHHISRFFSNAIHPQPPWFYLPVLLLGGFPWTGLLPTWMQFQFSRDPSIASTRTAAQGFFLLWAGWCLAFFSLSTGKMPAYILPAAPALAALLGVFLDNVLARPATRVEFHRPVRVTPLVVSLGLCAAWPMLVWVTWFAGLESWTEALCETLLCAAAALVVVALARRATAVTAWAVCCTLVLGLSYEAGRDLVPRLAESRSPVSGEGEMAALIHDPSQTLIVFGHGWGSVPFYLGRDNVRHFDGSTLDDLADLLRRRRQAVIFARDSVGFDSLAGGVPSDLALRRAGGSGRAILWQVEPIQQGTPVRSAGKAATTWRAY